MDSRVNLVCVFFAMLLFPEQAHSKVYYHMVTNNLNTNASALLANRDYSGLPPGVEIQVPYMVFVMASWSLTADGSSVTCTGSILTDVWVLTAAHCAERRPNYPYMFVAAGRANIVDYVRKRVVTNMLYGIDERAYGVQERKVLSMFPNPKYAKNTISGDIALLLMEKPFSFSNTVRPIKLSQSPMKGEMWCRVGGWGVDQAMKTTYLMKFADNVRARPASMGCTYVQSGPYICLQLGGPGNCQGDSGSPLVCDGLVWGVSSFGMNDKNLPICSPSQEEFYYQIYPELPWITYVMEHKSQPNSEQIYSPLIFLIFAAVKLTWIL
ncbi:UNVERIFIED_CONTAM: hypothetical protein PYX00_001495 [Menopon gallinae]|uniref:Peptidase S1 domain-containing protein n=1 Tax=Menopon gallinae TaxID=328185 RepID=A0AAW2IE80_9NEOP